MDYTATTTNGSNKINASADNSAAVSIMVNGSTVDNGSSASWRVGENTVTINVSEHGKAPSTYNIIVTKS